MNWQTPCTCCGEVEIVFHGLLQTRRHPSFGLAVIYARARSRLSSVTVEFWIQCPLNHIFMQTLGCDIATSQVFRCELQTGLQVCLFDVALGKYRQSCGTQYFVLPEPHHCITCGQIGGIRTDPAEVRVINTAPILEIHAIAPTDLVTMHLFAT